MVIEKSEATDFAIVWLLKWQLTSLEGMVSDEKQDGLARQLQVHSMSNIANGDKEYFFLVWLGITVIMIFINEPLISLHD